MTYPLGLGKILYFLKLKREYPMRIMLIALILFTQNLYALELKVKFSENFIESPLFILDSKLHNSIKLNSEDESQTLQWELAYFNQNGKILASKIWTSNPYSFEQCHDVFCGTESIALSQALYKQTCSTALKISSLEGMVLAEKGYDWGQCQTEVSTINTFDLSIAQPFTVVNVVTNTPFPETQKKLNFKINLNGPYTVQKNLRFMIIGENSKDEVIYTDSIFSPANLGTQNLIFKNISAWQNVELCRFRLYADSDNALAEISKENNEISFLFGQCKNTSNGTIDLTPVLNLENNEISLSIFNLGLKRLISIPVFAQFTGWDAEGNKLTYFERTATSSINGLGDFSLSKWPVINPKVCKVEVVLNSDYRISETNYNNNQFILNKCNSL